MRFRKTSKPEDLRIFGIGHKITTPSVWEAGVIFASPHSGSLYPRALIKKSNLSTHQLRRNEDIFVQQLFEGVVNAGAPLIEALFPRAFVDVNRDLTELPDHWAQLIDEQQVVQTTPRAAAGLGVVPTYLSETLPIYTKLPSEKDVEQRLSRLYRPYHNALNDLLGQSIQRFGRALLVDCHSMPGFAPMGSRRPDIILGDRFGTSCHSDTLAQFRSLFARAGYSVGINYPYAGGYTTSYYGDPKNGVETIQIEINRDLYVNPITLAPKPGFARLQVNISGIMADIISFAKPQDLAAQ
jgi:N-formylglutamate deformylase